MIGYVTLGTNDLERAVRYVERAGTISIKLSNPNSVTL